MRSYSESIDKKPKEMRQAVNILFLGGAKRVAMARLFKKAAVSLGLDPVIFSYELSDEVPIAEEASVIKGLRWSDPELMRHLHEVVEENRIDIIVPFVDPAVGVAARFCRNNPEVFAPCAAPEFAETMFDKALADKLFRQSGIQLPPEADGSDEVICKPRCGSASKGILVVPADTYRQMAGDNAVADKYIFQGYVADRDEYSVDCYVNLNGSFVCAIPRKRLEVSGGEVTSTITVHSPQLVSLSHEVLTKLGVRGAATLQFLRDRSCEGAPYMLMEVNPRLGGGAVCSVHAGADIPVYILSDWLGKPAKECQSWRENLKICRYPAEVVFDNGHLLSGKATL